MLMSIDIQNWKGHSSLHLDFQRGINFLTGPNGAGKTSVLDAVCFALVGDMSSRGSYKGITYRDLIQDPNCDMEISLAFSPPQSEQVHVITRAARAPMGRASAELLRATQQLTRRWDDATTKILEIYETSRVFFDRVISISEGDIYDYVNRSPGEDIAKHIENVLGLNRFEGLRVVMEELRRLYERESLKLRDELESAISRTTQDESALGEISKKIAALSEKRKTLSQRIAKLGEEAGSIDYQIKSLQETINQINVLTEEWRQSYLEVPDDYDFRRAAALIRASLTKERDSVLQQRDKLKDGVSRLLGEIDSNRKIMSLLEPELQEPPQLTTCPVCKRPLTSEMVHDIGAECSDTIARLTRQLEDKQRDLQNVDDSIRTNSTQLDLLARMETRINTIREQVGEIISVAKLQSRLDSLAAKRSQLQSQVDALIATNAKLDESFAELTARRSKIQEMIEPAARHELENELASAEKRSILAEAFLSSVHDTLAEQRRTLLRPLTGELSLMWSRLLGRDISVQFGDKGELVTQDTERGTVFKFPQLSGGEKTILLILTQVLLCKYFSKSDFMLLDEPLEHLDPKNRWAVINFLVESCRKGFPEQLIVTTIEESVLREYLEESTVRVIALS